MQFSSTTKILKRVFFELVNVLNVMNNSTPFLLRNRYNVVLNSLRIKTTCHNLYGLRTSSVIGLNHRRNINIFFIYNLTLYFNNVYMVITV